MELFPTVLNFFTSSERVSLLQAFQVSNQNFCIKKKFQNESKMFALSLKGTQA
jgi:hypothetical protein